MNHSADGMAPVDELVALVVDRRAVGAATVVGLTGEIDLATADEFDKQLSRAVTEDGNREPVVVDLSEVGFMGSAGLAVLVRHRQRCVELGRPFHIVSRQRAVLRVLEISGLDEVLPVAATVSDALNTN